MSSGRSWFPLVVVTAWTPFVQAAILPICPWTLNNQSLAHTELFGGPSENGYALVPDNRTGTSRWYFRSEAQSDSTDPPREAVRVYCYYGTRRESWYRILPLNTKSCWPDGTGKRWNIYCE